MKKLPALEEAAKYLKDCRLELTAMKSIRDNSKFLSLREDVDKQYYSSVYIKTLIDISNGLLLEKVILATYPTLT